jgi:hypothetical protein
MKTYRLHYAGHMIRRDEDLPKKSFFKAKPEFRSWDDKVARGLFIIILTDSEVAKN